MHTFVESRLDDSGIGVDEIAREIGMSRAQFYRKLKALTDCSPNEYVRVIRLRRAAGLLTEEGLTVAEVAYRVGFGTPVLLHQVFQSLLRRASHGLSTAIPRYGRKPVIPDTPNTSPATGLSEAGPTAPNATDRKRSPEPAANDPHTRERGDDLRIVAPLFSRRVPYQMITRSSSGMNIGPSVMPNVS